MSDDTPLNDDEPRRDDGRREPTLTRMLGFPPAAALLPVPVGAFACSLILDLGAKVNTGPCSGYTYPSFLLLVIGVVTGLVAVTVSLPDLARLPRGSRSFRSGVRFILLWDAALLLFGVSAYLRHDRDTCVDVAGGPFALSVAGAVLTLAALTVGLRMIFARRPARPTPTRRP